MAKFTNQSGRPLRIGDETIAPGGSYEAEKLPGSLRLMMKGFGAELDPQNPPAGAQLRPGDEQAAEDEAKRKAEEEEKAKREAEEKAKAAAASKAGNSANKKD